MTGTLSLGNTESILSIHPRDGDPTCTGSASLWGEQKVSGDRNAVSGQVWQLSLGLSQLVLRLWGELPC